MRAAQSRPRLGSSVVLAAAADAKLTQARDVLAEGSRLIWTDDTEVPESGPVYEELTADGRALLIRPSGRRGLRREHMEQISAFCRMTVEEAPSS